jgi:hypothetical protein
MHDLPIKNCLGCFHLARQAFAELLERFVHVPYTAPLSHQATAVELQRPGVRNA